MMVESIVVVVDTADITHVVHVMARVHDCLARSVVVHPHLREA